MGKICDSYTSCIENKVILFTKKDYPIMECKKCSHRFTEIPDLENHVSNVYSDDYFFEGAAGYP
ncbi:MAG TPA: hypothetical protein VK588_15315, partial [Chitinophagaceae bacterium]|nr:hypothetical protein [Chitinophagaceae bacterium]